MKKEISIKEVEKYKEKIIEEIKQGKIFIYPTDTIYGVGCNAYNVKSVKKIYKIKKRESEKPLSIIPPSLFWINNNFETKGIEKEIEEAHKKGKVTLILKKKDRKFMRHISKKDSMGIRFSNNTFTKIIEESGVPFISTSANISGKENKYCIDEIEDEIKKSVNYIIKNDKPLRNKASTIINPYTGEIIRQ